MLYGIGCDLCELAHLEKSLTGAHAAAFVRRVYGEAERAALGLDAPLPAGRSAAGSPFRFARSKPSGTKTPHRPIASAEGRQNGCRPAA